MIDFIPHFTAADWVIYPSMILILALAWWAESL